MASSPTTVIAGRYTLLEVIGEGGMGRVWRAHDQTLHRDVAVKEVAAPRGLQPGALEQLYRRTFREARSAARLDHPGIVTVHDVVEEDGRPWIVMQYVPAPSLAAVLAERGPLPPREVAAIGVQLLDALAAAHTAGVLHRDVKPGNVLLAGGRTILTDFGIATFDGDATITAAGAIIGSPAYLAPERARHLDATPAADLWSLGATLYAAVEGRPPYDSGDIWAMMAALLNEEPDRPRRAGPLAAVLTGLLHKDPEQRMTAAQAAPLLQQVAAAPPPSAAEVTPAPLLNQRLQPHEFPAERHTRAEPHIQNGPPTQDEPHTPDESHAQGGPHTEHASDASLTMIDAAPQASRRWLLITGGTVAVLLVAVIVIAATWTSTTGNGHSPSRRASSGSAGPTPSSTPYGTLRSPIPGDPTYDHYNGYIYRADIPKSWTQHGSDGASVAFVGATPPEGISLEYLGGLVPTGTAPRPALDTELSQLPALVSLSNFRRMGGVVEANDGSYAEAEFAYSSSGEPARGKLRVESFHDRLVEVLFMAPQSHWQQDSAYYQRLVSSLTAY